MGCSWREKQRLLESPQGRAGKHFLKVEMIDTILTVPPAEPNNGFVVLANAMLFHY